MKRSSDSRACVATTATMSAWQRRGARREGINDAQCGAVTVIQRFASGLRLNFSQRYLA